MMTEQDRGRFWWMNVPGPHRAVSAAADTLATHGSVLLRIPGDLAWPDIMHAVLEDLYKNRKNAFDVSVTRINAQDSPEGLDPAQLLLQRYASPATQRQYRPGMRISLPAFLRRNKVLTNRMIWVRGLDPKTSGDWIQFAAAFGSGGPQDGLFVLECCEGPAASAGSSAHSVDFHAQVTRDDVQLFTRFVLGASDNCEGVWADYATSIAARVCNTDAWLAARVADSPLLRTDGIVPALESLCGEPESAARMSIPGNAMHLLQEGDTHALGRRAWAAQVEVLFPIIEMERVELVRTWRDQIQAALDKEPVDRFGTLTVDADDVELGALAHLLGTRMQDGSFHLYLPDEHVRRRILFLHQCRNRLAHANICAPEEVSELLRPHVWRKKS